MTVRVGIIGLGFMGRTHLAAYRAAAAAGLDVRVVAACDVNIDRVASARGGNLATGQTIDLEGVRCTSEIQELVKDPEIDALSICTPTDTHVALAVAALEAGKHVLVEKPVALNPEDVRTVRDAAERSGQLCMPAMCMRFWPGWAWLRDAVQSGKYGKVRSATFQRLGSAPDWNPSFYSDPERSGGALFDLHIHDADFIYWCFGAPQAVRSTGGVTHVTTQYTFVNGPAHVVAEGGQDHAPGFGFRMRYSVAFEQATAEFDLGRTPQLLLYRNGGSETISTDGPSGYEAEVDHFVRAINAKGWRSPLRATLADAEDVTRILQAERRSTLDGTVERL
ncbi:MAG: Gfo/Idh/MocA family protein [Phycisphaerales bacterium]